MVMAMGGFFGALWMVAVRDFTCYSAIFVSWFIISLKFFFWEKGGLGQEESDVLMIVVCIFVHSYSSRYIEDQCI